MEGLHPADPQVEGRLQAATHRVHKVVLIIQDRMRHAVVDLIAPVQRVRVFLNLQQTAAVVRFRHGPPWGALMIPRVFVHELLNH